MKSIEITKRAQGQIEAGSVWIFANEFVTKMKDLTPGEWVHFKSGNHFIGMGYVNPHSLIAGRVCSFEQISNRQEFFEKRIEEALEIRREVQLFSGFGEKQKVGSFRAIFSESDGLPGLIVDCYETPAQSWNIVVASTTLGMDAAREDYLKALQRIFKPEGLVLKCDSSIRNLEKAPHFVEVIQGNENELRDGVVREGETLFAADFIGGQKTGFFLDQRPNREELKKYVKGKRVLDLCSYSGGWGITALKGGAQHVTFVDQSAEALNLVKKGLALNQLSEKSVTLEAQDVFDFLQKSKDEFDIVIADPPAFVKSKKNLNQALRAYEKLNTLALKRLKAGGLLFTCSCSYHLSESEFLGIVRKSLASSGFLGRLIYRGWQGSDHPSIINRPESQYLKCVAVRTSALMNKGD